MRPELLLVVWLLPAGLIVYAGLTSTSTKTMLVAAGLATLLAVAPPVVRNWSVFHAVIPFPTVGGVTFWGANNAVADGGWILPSPEVWPGDEPPASMRGWPELSEQRSQARFYQAAWTWIRENPTAYLALLPRKLVRSWTLSYADEARPNALPSFANILNTLFGLTVLAGMLISFINRRNRLAFWLICSPIVAWLIKTVVFYGSARQTALALPVLCIFAAIALEAVATRAHSTYSLMADKSVSQRHAEL